MALYVNGSNVIYFATFGVRHIPKKILKIHRKEKYHNKYLQNISISFDNV